MEWLSENWFWVAIAGVFIAMHFFGHRHGGHGGGCGGHKQQNSEEGTQRPTGHLH